MVRVGRRNVTVSVNASSFQKISTANEISRPHRLMVEAWALVVARQRGVYVPKVLGYFLDHQSREILTLERIKGECLSKTKNTAIHTRCMFDVGRQLRSLKNITSRSGWIESSAMLGSHGNWSDFIFDYVGTYADRLVDAKLLAPALSQKLFRLIHETNLDLPQSALVHRDLKWSNLILNGAKKVAIVDWENAILGDSLYDVAIFGVREGHTASWRELARGLCAETSSRRYLLYEAVALVGITEFHRQYETDVELKARLLKNAIEKL